MWGHSSISLRIGLPIMWVRWIGESSDGYGRPVVLTGAKRVRRQYQWHRFEVVMSGRFGLRCSDERTKMKPKSFLRKSLAKAPAEWVAKEIRRATRGTSRPKARFGSCWNVCAARTALPMRCRKEGIDQSLYYTWSKAFMGAGKRRRDVESQGRQPASEAAPGFGWDRRAGFHAF